MGITDHEYYGDYEDSCQFVYWPDNPLYHDPSGGFLLGGPIECGGTREQHRA
jgi:hypothetical protein